jgi:NSS family neurotransmitter:Na+ symporter
LSDSSKQQWGSKAGFLLSAIGSAVGLGNIWRYPYVLYRYGGGAFLIPYFIAIITAAIPLLILEYTMGIKFRGTSPLAWARMRKGFEWIGWVPTIVAGFILFYYSSILSWALNYFRYSFTQAWGNDPGAFFFGQFLTLSDGPMQIGAINWPIFFGLLLIWGGSFLLMSRDISKGLEICNKILMPLMFLTMVIIVIRGVMLPGATTGLNALFTPDFAAMKNPEVWLAAYGHVFFSTSLAMGIMITYSSYLPKTSAIPNSACVAGFANSAFEFTVAIGVFSILGFMATSQGVPVTEVVRSGVGLAFVAFPAGLNTMGSAGVFLGVIFFLCLIFAGYTSFVSLLEAFVAPMGEKWGIGRKKVFGIFCTGGFLASAIFCTGAGLYILDIVDYFLNNFGLIFVGIVEAIAIGWIINLGWFTEKANEGAYYKVGGKWQFCIKFAVPVILIISLGMTMYSVATKGYEGYPAIALVLFGWLVMAVCILLPFIFQKIKWATKLEHPDVVAPPPKK